VSLDPYHPQSGWVHLDMEALGLGWDDTYEVHDLLTGAHYTWHGAHNFVGLDPSSTPAHVFELRAISSARPTPDEGAEAVPDSAEAREPGVPA
jgi:starch synthase (maltosyl-transferring)